MNWIKAVEDQGDSALSMIPCIPKAAAVKKAVPLQRATALPGQQAGLCGRPLVCWTNFEGSAIKVTRSTLCRALLA
jgi:hypothetical protein